MGIEIEEKFRAVGTEEGFEPRLILEVEIPQGTK
jgi:hypothetical protein